jgi:hypothetical protein
MNYFPKTGRFYHCCAREAIVVSEYEYRATIKYLAKQGILGTKEASHVKTDH